MAAQNMKDHQNIQLRIMNIIIIHIILLGANPMLVRARQVLQYRFSRSFDVIVDNWLEINEALNLETNRFCSIQIIPWSSHQATPSFNFDFHDFLLIFPREVDRFTWNILQNSKYYGVWVKIWIIPGYFSSNWQQ